MVGWNVRRIVGDRERFFRIDRDLGRTVQESGFDSGFAVSEGDCASDHPDCQHVVEGEANYVALFWYPRSRLDRVRQFCARLFVGRIATLVIQCRGTCFNGYNCILIQGVCEIMFASEQRDGFIIFIDLDDWDGTIGLMVYMSPFFTIVPDKDGVFFA